MSVPEIPPETSAWIWSSDVLDRNSLEFSVGALPPPVAFSPWHSAHVVAKSFFPIVV